MERKTRCGTQVYFPKLCLVGLSGLTVLLSRHSVGTYPETSSHAACQKTFGHIHLSPLSHCGLILILALRVELVCASEYVSTLKKKKKRRKKRRQGMIGRTFFQNHRKQGESDAMYLRDITNATFVIIHLNAIRLSVCSSCSPFP